MTITVLFYRAPGTWHDRAVRLLTGSLYSHCELIAPGQSGPVLMTIAASKRDGNRVRTTTIDTRSGHWDLLTYPGDEFAAWGRAEALLGQPYDVLGAVLSGTALARPRHGRWFCSELVAHALGFREPHEFSPGMLAACAIQNTRRG